MTRRNTLVGISFFTALVALGIAEWALDRSVRARNRAGSPLRSRSVLAETAAELGPRETIGLGISSRITSGSCIASIA
jgi:hypothetical protein